MARRGLMDANALAFGETRSTRSVVFWRNGNTESTGGMEKRHPVALRALERLCLQRVHDFFCLVGYI